MDQPTESTPGDRPTAPLLGPPNMTDTAVAPPPPSGWTPPAAWAPPPAWAPPEANPDTNSPHPGSDVRAHPASVPAWKPLAAIAAVGLVLLMIGVLVVDSRVASADTADLEAGQQAFSMADCDQVRSHADGLDGRWRPPWIDGPRLTGQVGACSALDAALDGTPSAQVVALAQLRADTGHPSIRTAAGDRLQQLLASPELAEGADVPLCTEIADLQDAGKITAADHPFAALRRCGLRMISGSGASAVDAVGLFSRALTVAAADEVPKLSGDPAVVAALVAAPQTCDALDQLAPVLGATASTKYATCGDAALAAGDEEAAVDLYLALARLYPQSDEAVNLGPRLLGQPGLCPAGAPTASLPFAANPEWVAGHKLACARSALDGDNWTTAAGYLEEAVAQGAGTQPAADAAALLDSMRPASGTVLGEPTIKLSGRIGLEVNNNTVEDTVIGVLSDSGQALRFYVRANETTQVRKFPVGNYRLFVLRGSQWLPAKAAFGHTVEVSELSELFDVPAGYVGKTTLTLDAGPLGNVTSSPAACKDLEAAGLPATGDCTGPV